MSAPAVETRLQALPDRDLREAVRELVDRVEEMQEGFEESLLHQEQWTSVDLLQNVGIEHRRILDGLSAQLRQEGATADQVKAFLRAGRTTFSEWLFGRFQQISATSPSRGAGLAFERLLDRLQEVCGTVPDEFVLAQPDELLASAPDQAPWVRLAKAGKRLLRWLGKRRFQRRFSLRQVAEYHLVGRLPEGLLRVAHMLGEAEFFLLRRVRGIYEETDEAFNGLLAALDPEAGEPDVQRLEVQVGGVRGELEESFRLAGSEVLRYYGDIRAALGQVTAASLQVLVRDAGIAGTVELPRRRLRLSRADRERGRLRIANRLGLWERYQVGFAGAYIMHLEMVRVQDRLRHAVDQTVLQVSSRLRQHLEEQAVAVRQRLDQTAAVLRQARDSEDQPDRVRARLGQERGELLDYLSRVVQGNLEAIRASGEINQLIDLLQERFRRLADETVESFRILEEEDLPSREGQVPEEVELKSAPMRAVVRAYLEGDLMRRLGDVNGAMLGQVRELEAAVAEVVQSVGFSLGNVVIELREVGKKPSALVPVALSRLQRSVEGLQSRLERVERSNEETRERVIREVADTARMVRQLVVDETVRDMRRQVESQRPGALRRRYREWRKVPGSDALEALQAPVPEARPTVAQAEPAAEAGHTEALDFEGLLDLESELASRVPFAYRRLFRTTPLEVSEFLAGRAGALGAIEAVCRRWRQQRFATVVVIGEQGSGKTSLINCAMEQKLRGLPLVRYRIEETVIDQASFVRTLSQLLDVQGDTLDQLEERIARAHLRRIVLLEDLHRLHLRTVRGLDLLTRFLEFVDATGTQILWMVSIEEYAWQYLEQVLRISRHFAFRIQTGHLSRQELEGAIMARHRATGYGLRFSGPGSDGEAVQEGLRLAFFGQLSQACGGNVFSAIFYWLRSVERVEGDVVVIGRLEELRLDFLSALPPEELLDLAMIVQHGGLDPSQFGAVFRVSHLEARARLTYLERLGLLKRSDREGRPPVYTVNQILYHPVVVQLRKRKVFR